MQPTSSKWRGRMTPPPFPPQGVTGLERAREAAKDGLTALIAPLARVLGRLRVHPNQVSVLGVLVALAAAALIAADALWIAGLVYLLSGGFDLLDGVLAREAGTESSFGAFLDSTLDRIGEGAVFAAIGYHFAWQGEALLAAAAVLALLGSILVSYTRARAEGLGVDCKVGVFTRAERVVLLVLGLLTGLLPLAVLALVVLTALTTGQRILHTRRELRGRGA